MLACVLQEHSEHVESKSELHRDKMISRAIAIREAIQKAGIQLPPLRSIEEREEACLRSPGYSVPQIVWLSGADSTTVNKWLGRPSGPMRKKQEAVRFQEPAVFTQEEMQTLLRAGGGVESLGYRKGGKQRSPSYRNSHR